jgi:hypothetical protein
MTTTNQLVIAAYRMRNAQKAYYQRPITPRLIRAKKLERELDELIEKEHGVLTLPYRDEEHADPETY